MKQEQVRDIVFRVAHSIRCKMGEKKFSEFQKLSPNLFGEIYEITVVKVSVLFSGVFKK